MANISSINGNPIVSNEADSIGSDLQNVLIRQILEPSKFTDGYYNRGATTVHEGTSSKIAKPFRVRKGVSYTFKEVYGYFCTIFYDDGTNETLDSTLATHITKSFDSMHDDGWAYVTIGINYLSVAMVIEGYSGYDSDYFVGYGFGLSVFPKNNVSPYTYAALLPKMEDAKANSLYRITTTTAMTVSGTMTDVPDELKQDQRSSLLITVGYPKTIICYQILIVETGNIYIRYYKSDASNNRFWTEWLCTSIKTNDVINQYNYSTILPSLSESDGNSVYNTILSTAMSGSTMDDVPAELKNTQYVLTLETIGKANTAGTIQRVTVANSGITYVRFYNYVDGVGFWTDWRKSNASDPIIVRKDGLGHFSSLTAAIAYAVKSRGSHVIVEQGTFDIISEYEELYGSDFFDSFTDSETNVGIVLSNEVHVEFAPSVKVVCHYTGDNSYVQSKFSPFNAGEFGFTIVGLNLSSKRVRYGVHDEYMTQHRYYHNRYVACSITHDPDGGSGYIQCIGGGLGKNGLIEIIGCKFSNPNSTGAIVSWHNSSRSDAKSKILIRDCIVDGTVRFSWYGTSTEISEMLISNCKLYSEPFSRAETSGSTVENVEITSWNNVVGAPSA